MLNSCGWGGGLVAHSPFNLDMTGTRTGTWPGDCQLCNNCLPILIIENQDCERLSVCGFNSVTR